MDDSLPALTEAWRSKGFIGTCIGSTVVGKNCFFMDVIVSEAASLSPSVNVITGGSSTDGDDDPEATVTASNATASPPFTAISPALPVTPQPQQQQHRAPTLHLVGNHVVQKRPRTLRKLLERVVRRMTTSKDKEGGGVSLGGRIDGTATKSEAKGGGGACGTVVTGKREEPFFLSLTIARDSSVSMTDDAFEALVASLRANPLHADTPPAPRIGDCFAFPPNSVFIRPLTAEKVRQRLAKLVGTKKNIAAGGSEVEVRAERPAVAVAARRWPADFATHRVLGRLVPAVVVQDGISLRSRGPVSRPADYADKWQLALEGKAREEEEEDEGMQKDGALSNIPIGRLDARTRDDEKHDIEGGGTSSVAKKKGPANSEGRTGHSARFLALAEWIASTFQLSPMASNADDSCTPAPSPQQQQPIRMIDVAGGGGKLSCELALMGFHCTVVDPRIISPEGLAKAMDAAIRQQEHRAGLAAHRERMRQQEDSLQSAANKAGDDASADGGTSLSHSAALLGSKRSREGPSSDVDLEAKKNVNANRAAPSAAPCEAEGALPSSPSPSPSSLSRVERKAAAALRHEALRREALGRITLCPALFDAEDMLRLRQQQHTSEQKGDTAEPLPSQHQRVEADTDCTAVDDGSDGDGASSPPSLPSPFDLDLLVRGCDLIVGLHCDGAVNSIIEAACRHNKSCAIIPCCVFPNEFPRRLEVDGDGHEDGAGFVEGEEVIVGVSESAPSGQHQQHEARNRRRTIPVVERAELIRWIPQQFARLGYRGVVRTCVPDGLVGANVCVYGKID